MKEDTKKIEPRTLKGFRDFGLLEESIRQGMLKKIAQAFEMFGFLPLSTPVLEYKEILLNKYGEDEKLVYSFTDTGDREVAMRYDLTVPMARYVAQNQNTLTFPFKRYQIAPVWRAENTQRGRSREFYQCDVDVVGTESLTADAEVIACACKAYEALGIQNYLVRINNRKLFNAAFGDLADESVITELLRSIDKVDKIGIDAVIVELKNKNIDPGLIERTQSWLSAGKGEEAFEKILSINSNLNEPVRAIKSVISLLESQGIAKENIIFDPVIARGLDYYTDTVFEIYLADDPKLGAIGSGGRYDGLLDTFSDKPLPAVGASIGIDRLFEFLEEKQLLNTPNAAQVLIFNLDEGLLSEYLELANTLRKANIKTEIYYDTAKLDKQFKYAESKNIPFGLLIGQEENSKGVMKLKNLSKREEEELSKDAVIEKLTNKSA